MGHWQAVGWPAATTATAAAAAKSNGKSNSEIALWQRTCNGNGKTSIQNALFVWKRSGSKQIAIGLYGNSTAFEAQAAAADTTAAALTLCVQQGHFSNLNAMHSNTYTNSNTHTRTHTAAKHGQLALEPP